MGVPRVATFLFVLYAATMGWDLPAPPVPIHAVWADLFLVAATLVALVAWRPRPTLVPIAYAAWVIVAAHGPGRHAMQIGAVALCVVCMLASVTDRDRVLRAWIFGAVVLGAIGLMLGIAAQLGITFPGLHDGAGELGLALRPAGFQRVGLLAELCLVPFLLVVGDASLLGNKARRGAIGMLALVLVAGLTRTVLAAALGLALLRLRSRSARVLVGIASIAVVIALARVDVHGSASPGIRWRIAAAAFEHARGHLVRGIDADAPVAIVGWPGPGDPARVWDAHCTPLDLVARSGLPALALFALVVALALLRTRGTLLHVALWATSFDALSVDVERFRHVWLLLGLALAFDDARSSKVGHAPCTRTESSSS